MGQGYKTLPHFFKMKIRLIIFDLDGTLVDAYAAINKSFNYAMRKSGYPVQSAAVIRKSVGWGDRKLLAPFVRGKDLKEVLRIYRKHHASSLIRHSKLLPGARSVLARLKDKGYKLAVASNRPLKFSRLAIRSLKLDRYFSYIACADKIGYAKPKPQILLRILKRFGVKPAEALYIGDMYIDAQAGKNAGIKTIVVPTGSSSKKEIRKAKPYALVRNLKGLYAYL